MQYTVSLETLRDDAHHNIINLDGNESRDYHLEVETVKHLLTAFQFNMQE